MFVDNLKIHDCFVTDLIYNVTGLYMKQHVAMLMILKSHEINVRIYLPLIPTEGAPAATAAKAYSI